MHGVREGEGLRSSASAPAYTNGDSYDHESTQQYNIIVLVQLGCETWICMNCSHLSAGVFNSPARLHPEFHYVLHLNASTSVLNDANAPLSLSLLLKVKCCTELHTQY